MKDILKSKTIIGFIVIVLALTVYGSKKNDAINNLNSNENADYVYLYEAE